MSDDGRPPQAPSGAGAASGAPAPALAVGIVLSYRRPGNIARVVASLLQATRVARVIVSNNNPDVDLAAQLPGHPRVELRQQPRHARSGLRFAIAAQTHAEHFVAVDDDLFVTAEQVDRLLAHLARDPSVPHGGPWGQRLVRTPQGRIAWRGPLFPDQRVDVLNRLYAFTREHARRFVAIAARLGEADPAAMGPIDDIVLSHCGATRPFAHDLGPWEDCPSSHDPDIAMWRQPGFAQARNDAIGRLRTMARERDAARGAEARG